jgi:hypothetical protein
VRRQFVPQASEEGATVRERCRRSGSSPPTAAQWWGGAAAGDHELADRARRPPRSPRRTAPAPEAPLLARREAQPAWGAQAALELVRPGAHRAARSQHDPGQPRPPRPARPRSPGGAARLAALGAVGAVGAPRALAAGLQGTARDCKGHVPLAAGQGRCQPLTVLAEHARFALGVDAWADADETATTVQPRLTRLTRLGRLTSRCRRYARPAALRLDAAAG